MNSKLVAVDIETEKIPSVCPTCYEDIHFVAPNDPVSDDYVGHILRCPACNALTVNENIQLSSRPLRIICVDFCWRHEDGVTIENKPFGTPGQFLDDDTALAIREFMDDCHSHGCQFTGVNVVGFDFKHLYHAGAMPESYYEIVMRSFDPMFTAVCEFGYPLGLDALGYPLGLSKMEHWDGVKVSGASAADLWFTGKHDAVIAYIQQDTYQSLAVAEAALDSRVLEWRNSKGAVSTKPFRSTNVTQALRRPAPDTSWMTSAMPVTRRSLTAWIPSEPPVREEDEVPF